MIDKMMIISAVCGALLGGLAGIFLLSPLGYWFPEEKNFSGAVKKSRENRRITVLTGIMCGILSGIGAFFAEDILISVINVLLVWALTVIFTVDFRTYEIPFKINIFIFVLGILRIVTLENISRDIWLYIIGFFAVSVPLAAIFYLSRGGAIGFGDVKMMAACGILIGWKNAVFALIIGCIVGSVIHLIRMKTEGEGAVLAMGPYLAIGVYISALFGEGIINAYLSLLG